MKAKVLLLGSSHTKAIATATADVDNFQAFWVKSPKRDDGPGDIAVEEALQAAAELSAADLVAVSWIGTYHNIFGLVQHERPFDFFEPGSSQDPDPSMEIIPYAVLRDHFMQTISGDSFTKKVGQATKAKFVIPATPPPKGDNDFIGARMKNYRGIDVAKAGVTAAHVRAKLWRLEMKCIEAYCSTIGAQFVSPPAEAVTEDGYLRANFYGNDATHANAAYGALVKAQLLSLLGSPAPSAAVPAG